MNFGLLDIKEVTTMDLKIKKMPIIIMILIIVIGNIINRYINIDSFFSGEGSLLIFFLICFGILLCLGIYFFRKDVLGDRIYDKIETISQSLHSEVCGGRFGWYNLTIPFVKLDIYEDYLLIRFPFNRIKLNKNSIISIKKTDGYLYQSIEIIHGRVDFVNEFTLWVTNVDVLLDKLKENEFIP